MESASISTNNNATGCIEGSRFYVDGSGQLYITNTGGSSAAEGGMGTGGGTEKGAGIQSPTGDKEKSAKENAENNEWDPLKPEKDKERDNA